MSALVNSIASWAVTDAGTLASGDFGGIITFFLAFALLATVVGLVYLAIRKRG